VARHARCWAARQTITDPATPPEGRSEFRPRIDGGRSAFGIFCGLLAAVVARQPWSVTQYGALILCNLPAVGAIALTDPQDAFAVGWQIANCLICGGLGAIATAFAS
jgi:hypothetical protein